MEHFKWMKLCEIRNDSPFKNNLSIDFKNIDVEDLTNKIHQLMSYEHYVYYYGRKNISEILIYLTSIIRSLKN